MARNCISFACAACRRRNRSSRTSISPRWRPRFGFEARTIRTLEDLQAAAPLLRSPQGPVFLDCKLNADVAAPFMSEFYAFETGKH